MDKEDIIKLFLERHIIKKTKSSYSKSFKWKQNLIKDCLDVWNNYYIKYRSESEAWYCLLKGIEPPICLICGNLCSFKEDKGSTWYSARYNTVCEKHSANQIKEKRDKASQTKLNKTKEEKDRIKNKTISTNLERYGEEFPFKFTSERQNKILLDKYGTIYPTQMEEIKLKVKSTVKERYGVDYILQDKERIEKGTKEKYNSLEGFYKLRYSKAQESLISKYGSGNIGEIKEFKDKRKKNKLKGISKYEKDNNCTLCSHLIRDYGQGWFSLQLPIVRHNGYTFIDNKYLEDIKNCKGCRSTGEGEIISFLESLNIFNVIRNSRSIINPYELDIYLPEYKLAIEFDGIFFHSTNNGVSKDYHLMKTNLCEEKGIRLIHIFEDIWYSKKDICKSIIKEALSKSDNIIGAKECLFKKVSVEAAKEFINKNGIQNLMSYKESYGLFYEDNLVQIIALNENNIIVECPLLNTTIIGGLDRLVKESNLHGIMYVDKSLFKKEKYIKSGFSYLEDTPPDYYLISNTNKLKRYTANEVKEMYDKCMQIYDCGKIKLII